MLTKNDIFTLAFSSDGSPYSAVAANDTYNMNALSFSAIGSPYWAVEEKDTPPIIAGNIKRILKVNWTNVKTVNKAIDH